MIYFSSQVVAISVQRQLTPRQLAWQRRAAEEKQFISAGRREQAIVAEVEAGRPFPFLSQATSPLAGTTLTQGGHSHPLRPELC